MYVDFYPFYTVNVLTNPCRILRFQRWIILTQLYRRFFQQARSSGARPGRLVKRLSMRVYDRCAVMATIVTKYEFVDTICLTVYSRLV